MSQQINRSLQDRDMDRIDHALGRPLDPMADTYRNFYAISGSIADELAASPYWSEGNGTPGGLRYFSVSDAGRACLANHLREIGDRHRAFVITFDGHASTVVAKSRVKAKYSHFLDLSEVMPDLTFGDYCRRASVRVAA